jgi:hypothetical protein
MGQLEAPLAAAHRTGECAFFMAEEFAFQRVSGKAAQLT